MGHGEGDPAQLGEGGRTWGGEGGVALHTGVCGTKHWEMVHLSLGRTGVCGMGRANWATHALLGKGAAAAYVRPTGGEGG